MQLEVPPAMTAADCDLRDFAFMPLDVVRLRDSDLAALGTAEAFRAAVLLWCASWHQVPAGSLPDDDKVLANLAGYGRVVKEWLKERNGALRGWVKCADQRLYHPVVAEKANEAWTAKLRQRLKTECGRIKKHNDRHGTRIQFPDFDAWLAAGCPVGQPLPVPGDNDGVSRGTEGGCPSVVPTEKHSKGQGEGQRQGQGQGSVIPSSPPLLEIEAVGGAAQTPTPPPPPFRGESNLGAIPTRAVVLLAANWELPEAWGTDAEALGFSPPEILRESERFRQYWVAGKGSGTRRSLKGWRQSWSNWLAKVEPQRRTA